MLSYLWMIPICMASFACTRGMDGELSVSMFVFPLVGLSHNFYCAWKKVHPKHTSLQFFAFTAGSYLSGIVFSQIDGMAGMILFIIPSIVAFFALISVIFTVIIYRKDSEN